jgi:hypothetical protein
MKRTFRWQVAVAHLVIVFSHFWMLRFERRWWMAATTSSMIVGLIRCSERSIALQWDWHWMGMST